MRERMQVYATLIIWFFLTGLMLGLFTIPSSAFADASAGVTLTVLITLAITAMISTMGIWGQLSDSESDTENAASVARKPKRVPYEQRRLARLVDTLDEDDVDALEALLAEREAEAQRAAYR